MACNGMICQQATLAGETERPKVADAVIEAAGGGLSRQLRREWAPLTVRHFDRAGILSVAQAERGINRTLAMGYIERRRSGAQSASWFPLHICGVKPTVSEKPQFNQRVCGAETKHALHTREALR